MLVIEILYVLCVSLLSLYGLNNLVLTWLYVRHRHDPTPEPAPPAQWPLVTVQLPIYNELHMARRLLDAAAQLDYPPDRLEIQVLDDSTDATRELVARRVEGLQRLGLDVTHVTRPDRTGYKAGALAAGLSQTNGELVAIFDADFLPEPDFLRRLVPHFAEPDVGCIQARWGHVNRDYSVFTQTQALGVDGHFVVQQTARSRAGLFLNFNGTAGIWRRACIEDAGGWQGDTLTEDLDLSYRAQLRGWRIAYLPDVVVPAELPAQISAFKRQQARWAQGSIETALKLMGAFLRSDQPWHVKLEGSLHLTGYLVHPLMLAVILLTFPMSFSQSWVILGLPWLVITALGPPLLYIVAQMAGSQQWRYRLRFLPLLVALGMGLSLSNAGAVLRAVLGVRGEFKRTPKFDIKQSADSWVGSVYALRGDWLVWAELLLAGMVLVLLVLPTTRWTFMPWLLLYATGFGYVALVNLYQTYQVRRFLHGARQPRST
ncbi:MAG: glycosyltransferase family 2 protein [Anaerolineae bacterium]|jgi:cellulose synthase/poly-beta-1,6-N-acetylglucosamine synthase-like glycosyltransferase